MPDPDPATLGALRGARAHLREARRLLKEAKVLLYQASADKALSVEDRVAISGGGDCALFALDRLKPLADLTPVLARLVPEEAPK